MADSQVNTASLLHELYDMGKLPILKDGRCRQFSSYDRNLGNADSGNYLSIDENGTALLAEMDGPGAIVRIWSANPRGTLNIYIDGKKTPVVDMPFKDYFTDPSLHPLRTTSSGGFISYFPIPYAKSCRVEVEDPHRFYYQITYQTYPQSTDVRSFTGELSAAEEYELSRVLGAWQNPGVFRPTAFVDALGKTTGRNHVFKEAAVPGNATKTIFTDDKPACIDELTLNTSNNYPLDLRRTVMRIYWDGSESPSVEAPISDLFGSGYGTQGHDNLTVGVNDGTYYLRFPMPYAQSCRIEIENGNKRAVTCKLGVRLRRLAELDDGVGRFCARFHQEITKQGIPYTILQTFGRGHFCGTNMTMQGDSRGIWFLEGDEIIYVDRESFPSIYGTGSEDYFNSGWYFRSGPVVQPLHALTVKDPGNAQIGVSRYQVPDYVPFDDQINVRMEHGGGSDYPGADYSSVAYYYQTLPHYDFYTMPKAEALGLPRRSIPSEDWELTADKLGPATGLGGNARLMDWEKESGLYKGSGWKLDSHQANASISFHVDVPVTDRYVVSVFMGLGNECGPVKLLVDGQQVGKTKDFYLTSGPYASERIDWGEVKIAEGTRTMTFEVAGLNKVGSVPDIIVNGVTISAQRVIISDWLVVGPFPRGLDDPQGPEKGQVDTKAHYTGLDGADVTWKKVSAKDRVDLRREVAPINDASAYALTYIISPDSRDADLLLGSDDGIKALLNGNEVHKNDEKRGINIDDDIVKIHLKKGVNTLLVKIDQYDGWWGFVARIPDVDSELAYTLEMPE